MAKFWVVSTRRENGPEFEVINYNAATKEAELRGKYGGIFKESIAAEKLKEMGYKLEKREG
jgi:hypothetical protein